MEEEVEAKRFLDAVKTLKTIKGNFTVSLYYCREAFLKKQDILS